MARFTPVPQALKRIQPYLKIAEDHEKKDIVIAYWCRLYAVQVGLKVNEKTKDCTTFLFSIMDWLEETKKENPENDALTNEVVAQAHIENHALKLFEYADAEDRASKFHKNMVKAFYTAGLIYDIVSVFGDVSEEVTKQKKYAQWKATYIHNCLKNGVSPIPGPVAMEGEEDDALNNESNFNCDVRTAEDSNVSEQKLPSNPPIGFVPYPVDGPFGGNSSFHPASLIPPVPGAHAPPSTPNNSSQPPPPASSLSNSTNIPVQSFGNGDVTLRPEDFHKAQKYCKFAGSALQYEDVPTAIDNLQKALLLLTTGKDEK